MTKINHKLDSSVVHHRAPESSNKKMDQKALFSAIANSVETRNVSQKRSVSPAHATPASEKTSQLASALFGKIS